MFSNAIKYLILSLLLFTVNAYSQNFNSLINYSKKNSIQTSISVRSVNDTTQIVRYNSNNYSRPASNLKLITTAYIIDEYSRLGYNLNAPCFITTVGYNGIIKDHTLHGDLIIKATGDPTIDQKFIDTIVATLKSKNIKHIQGIVYLSLDEVSSNPVPQDYLWSDMGNYYGAGNFGMNFNSNTFNVYFKSGSKVGAATSFASVSPMDSTWEFVNNVTTGPTDSGDQCIIYTSPYSKKIICEGTIPLGSSSFKVRGAIPNPPALFISELMGAFVKKNIRIAKNNFYVSKAVKIENEWIRYPSKSTIEFIKDINFNSNNLFAECVYQKARIQKGMYTLNKWLCNQGLDSTLFMIRDANGMSAFNLVKSEQMSLLLSYEFKNKTFLNTIPQVGKEGTVKSFVKSCTTNTRLKSGSMQQTLCYSGYIQGKSGVYYAVSILTNNSLSPVAELKKEVEKGILEFVEGH
jgi:D-alanyl-D-alanine carboxypeptidase/D-alanyl-D-alanine-endopeptidase (penicillin-binding protein 4)